MTTTLALPLLATALAGNGDTDPLLSLETLLAATPDPSAMTPPTALPAGDSTARSDGVTEPPGAVVDEWLPAEDAVGHPLGSSTGPPDRGLPPAILPADMRERLRKTLAQELAQGLELLTGLLNQLAHAQGDERFAQAVATSRLLGWIICLHLEDGVEWPRADSGATLPDLPLMCEMEYSLTREVVENIVRYRGFPQLVPAVDWHNYFTLHAHVARLVAEDPHHPNRYAALRHRDISDYWGLRFGRMAYASVLPFGLDQQASLVELLPRLCTLPDNEFSAAQKADAARFVVAIRRALVKRRWPAVSLFPRLTDDFFQDTDPLHQRVGKRVGATTVLRLYSGETVGTALIRAGGAEAEDSLEFPDGALLSLKLTNGGVVKAGAPAPTEDGIYVAHYRLPDGTLAKIIAWCDGVSLSSDGGLAASAFLQGVHARVAQAAHDGILATAEGCFASGRMAILKQQQERRLQACATTAGVLVIMGDQALIATCGDSPLAELRGGGAAWYTSGYTAIGVDEEAYFVDAVPHFAPNLYRIDCLQNTGLLVGGSDGMWVNLLGEEFMWRGATKYRAKHGAFPPTQATLASLNGLAALIAAGIIPERRAGQWLHDAALKNSRQPGSVTESGFNAVRMAHPGKLDHILAWVYRHRTGPATAVLAIPPTYAKLEPVFSAGTHLLDPTRPTPHIIGWVSRSDELYLGNAPHVWGYDTIVAPCPGDPPALLACIRRAGHRYFLRSLAATLILLHRSGQTRAIRGTEAEEEIFPGEIITLPWTELRFQP